MKKILFFALGLFSILNAELVWGASDPLEQVIQQHAREMQENYGLRLLGAGGQMMHGIKSVSLEFTIDGEKAESMEELRQLVVTGSLKLLDLLNDSEGLRHEITNYPLTINDLGYGVFRDGPEGGSVSEGLLAGDLFEGEITYIEIIPPFKQQRTIFEETFEEAQQKVPEANN